MIFARLGFLPALAAAIGAAIAACGASAAEPDPVELRIEIYGFAGFHVLTNRTSLAASGDRYRITMDLDTRGIATIFVDLTSHSEVSGQLISGAVHPATYYSDVRRNSVDRRYQIDYHGDGTIAAEASPPVAALATSSAADQLRGTVDQLTAYFILERQLARSGTCALVLSVFDGRNRYNLRFTDAGAETLSADGHQHFAGQTQVCNVAREDLPGFAVNSSATEGTYRTGKIWYAHVAGGGSQMVPVRMEFDTEFGRVHGYLAELRGRGIDFHFMD
jgi:Protein of unknown function (DUF3108)